MREKVASPINTNIDNTIAEEHLSQVAAPPKVSDTRRYTHNHQAATADLLIDALAEWLYETVTCNFDFTREVYEHAKFQIVNGLLEPHQGKIAATSVKGLIKELGPISLSDDGSTRIGEYANWLLAVLLVFRQPPGWMCTAIEAICGRALKRAEEARYDGCTDKRLYRSPSESIGA